MKLVVATNNQKKRKELAAILKGLSIELVNAADTRFVDVDEDGETFAANARKKAEAFAQANNCAALADDSGLMVDALDGEPGVYSSRYAGEEASDADNNARLLDELSGKKSRAAHFVCSICLIDPATNRIITAEGRVDGEILEAPAGDGGFGYDPLFFSPELGKAFALATPEEKASVSHRGRALRDLVEQLQEEE